MCCGFLWPNNRGIGFSQTRRARRHHLLKHQVQRDQKAPHHDESELKSSTLKVPDAFFHLQVNELLTRRSCLALYYSVRYFCPRRRWKARLDSTAHVQQSLSAGRLYPHQAKSVLFPCTSWSLHFLVILPSNLPGFPSGVSFFSPDKTNKKAVI